MYLDRRIALLRLALQLFLLALCGGIGFFLGTRAGFSGWKSLAITWGFCALLLCLLQYYSATEQRRKESH